MKTIKFSFLFFAAVMMSFTASDSTRPLSISEIADTRDMEADAAFQHGERLTYKIYYNLNFVWIAAGEVTFKVFDEGTQYHYQAKGRTYDSYEWFFSVKDDYDSWVDKNSYYPNYSERSVNEGGYHIFEKISFNQSAKNMTVWRSEKRGAAETKTEHSVKEQVHDVLSSLYFLRNFDVSSQQSGFTIPFRVFMDKEEFPLRLRYVGKDARKKIHNMGRYKTLKLHPDVIAGTVFTEDAKMTVWVSDDQNKIPLLIESPVSVGSVKMVIKEYWGLKYPFEAKAD
jgi:Protein of unknown function (DUF3108)